MGKGADPGGGAVDGGNAHSAGAADPSGEIVQRPGAADEIDEEQPRVIVAGFGRFGQIAGRLLLSSGVKMVILDHDPDHVDTLRKFDMKVFYGDATRVDLLESAGAEKAEVLINAIDDPHVSLQLVARVKEHFPHLQIISRARDVDHYIQLRQAGVEARSVKPSRRR
jgi:glutathione-regulated potassium-efflux system ancillary protein KefC